MNACSLKGRRCVVTGATSGIGFATVEALIALGAEVVFVGRDPARVDKAGNLFQSLASKCDSPSPLAELADLSLMAEVGNLASRLAAAKRPIDVLVNCAGIYTAKRTITSEGLETQFAVNHLASFHLSNRLLASMSPGFRIATVSSASHYYGRIHWRDPSLAGCYFGLWAYEQSKLANVLFSYELARRLENRALPLPDVWRESIGTQAPKPNTAPTIFAIDPGLVNTDMGQKHARGLASLFWGLHKRRGTSPAQPAAGIAALVSSTEATGRNGLYWRDAIPLRSSLRSYDVAAAKRLWELSETMIERAISHGLPKRG